ncbi:MAG: SusC/RagA family TonB-linked outer membrane protein [Bacteroidales bacterium]|nr:SusC/RagA family TonB-linked outer membrane protein [Bacteroidales bacterium]
MRKFTLFLALIFFIGMQVVQAQTSTVTGTVTNAEDGSTIPGVSVVVKGTTFGTTTDLQGKFTLNVPPDAQSLIFSFVGMKTTERAIAGKSVINVALEPEITAIEGVVVTALGITREKKSLGYATQELGGDDINTVKRDNFISSLSGKAAGIQVKSNNNMGGSTNIIIRGNASITGNNQALIVVDGVPVNNDNTNNNGQISGRSGYDYGNAASDIDPANIASVNVLKGAAATALYGSRAANGVIEITTKKGQKTTGGTRILGVAISSNVTTGFVDKSTFPKYQTNYGGGYGPYYSGGDYPGLYEYDFDGDGTDDLVVPTTEDASMGERFDPNLMVYQYDAFYPSSPNYGKKTPWVAGAAGPIEFFETPWSFSNNVDITGGGEKTTFRLSYTNLDQTGIMPNSSLKKNNFLFNGTYDILDNLKITASANYVNTKGKGRNSTGYSDNILSSFRQWYQMNVDLDQQKELYEMAEQNITWNPNDENNLAPIYWDNPYWVRYQNYQNDERNRLIAYSQVDWKITDYLSLMGRASIDTYDELQEERKAVGSVSGELGVGRPDVTSGYARLDRSFRETNFDLLAKFNKYLAENLSFNALLGTNIRRSKVDQVYASTDGGLIIPGLYALSNSANSMQPPEERLSEIGVNGIFAGVSLGYNELVYLDANIRRDQSSTLPEENNEYYYPSVSTSFLFNNLLESATWMQLGKIRLAYAQVGNDAPWGSTKDTYDNNGLFGGVAMFSVPNNKANALLKPERTSSIEAGLEMVFFQNRFGFDFAYYKNNTVDQIIPVAVSYATGYSGKYVNAGEVENKGIELTLRGTPVVNSDFRWDITLNWAQNKNTVVALEEGLENLQLAALQGGVTINARVGEPYGVIQGTDYVYEVKDANGNVIAKYDQPIVGSNGYYLRTETSDNILGDINPDWNAGFNNAFSYKNWTLSFLIDFQQGGSIFTLDQWYGMATGLYEETDYTNDLGNPVRSPIVQNEDGSYASNSGGLILPGVDEDGNPNTVRVEGGDYRVFGYSRNPNSKFVYDASYIKLRELVISYSIPKAALAKTPLQGATFSLVGSNLWIISKDLTHADPEATQSSGNVQGWQSGVMPTTRNIGLTVNLQF